MDEYGPTWSKILIGIIIVMAIGLILAQARRYILAEVQTIYIQGCRDTGASKEWCVNNSNEFMKK
jgi:hypothetical protein